MALALSSVIERLAKFDTPTVCNVVELFDLRPYTAGYMDRRIQACFPKLPPMVGIAATATFRSSSPPARGTLYSSLSEQVESFAALPGPRSSSSRISTTRRHRRRLGK